MYVCMYVCISLSNTDKFCLYNLFKILSGLLIRILVSGWN